MDTSKWTEREWTIFKKARNGALNFARTPFRLIDLNVESGETNGAVDKMNNTEMLPGLQAFLDASLAAPAKSICIYYEKADLIPETLRIAGQYCKPYIEVWRPPSFTLHNGTHLIIKHHSIPPVGYSLAVIGGRYPDEYKAFIHPETGVAV